MSPLEKVSQADMLDYHTGAIPDPHGYAAFAQPPDATHLLYPSTLPGEHDQLHYMTGSDLSAQFGPYDENRSSQLDPRLRHVPEITTYTPIEGPQGCRVYVYIRTVHDLLAPPALSVFLSFASKRVSCLIESLPSDGPLKQYALSAEVPSFHDTGFHSFEIPLRIVMDATTGVSAPQAVEVGAFTHLGPLAAPHELSRKRKLSTSSDEALLNVNKRSLGAGVRSQDGSTDYAFSTSAASPYSPFLPTPTSASLFQNRIAQTHSPRSFTHHYSASTASQASIKAPSPHTPSFSPSFGVVNKLAGAPSPAVSVTPAARASATSSPGKDGNPTLVRTSTIQPSSAGTSVMVGSTSPGFNPYAMYPHKANLKLNGDLNTMAEGWKLEEWEAKRRLVQFTRRQKESTIFADFKGISPEERQPNSICISCIWWEEKKECFVTSVDTIHLLESLVAVRFTVEEKNRIRRNLEGFRPLTVSKSKADSDDFFKVIMGFPNPKPRNIEKDVKVFPWKILGHALKKIIGKYSASYSSTAGALSTPSSYAATAVSENSPEAHDSPRSNALTMPLPTAYNTYRSQASPMPPITAQPAYSLPVAYSYQGPAQLVQPMSAPRRPSTNWDFSPFVNSSAAPAAVQAYTYNRPIPPVSYATYPTTRS